MKKTALVAVLAAAVLATGCASKKFVRGEVAAESAAVNARVDDVENQVEENQTAISDNEADIQANEEELGRQQEVLDNASKTAREAYDRALAAGELAEGKLLYEVTFSDDNVRFGFDEAVLSPEAEAAVSEFAQQLKTENRNVFIEVQGHTDSVGDPEYNYGLGMSRATAVRRFLNLRGLPLHRLAVISYGESEPIADEDTREGRAQNRRVVLVVLE